MYWFTLHVSLVLIHGSPYIHGNCLFVYNTIPYFYSLTLLKLSCGYIQHIYMYFTYISFDTNPFVLSAFETSLTNTHKQQHTKGNPSSMRHCDVITLHLMWKIIQTQWDGKCSAVYHRNWHCLLPSSTSFALSHTHNYSHCLAVIHISLQCITCLI